MVEIAAAKAGAQFAMLTARLKPCPYYKTAVEEFFSKLFSRAVTGANLAAAFAAEGCPSRVASRKVRLISVPRRAGRLLVAGVCCVFALSLLAQSAGASAFHRARSFSPLLRNGWDNPKAASVSASTPNAKELAQRLDRHYNSLHSLKAGFTENYKGLGTERSESGTLLLLKPGRMRWDYSSPPGKLFLLDGKYAWSYTKGDAQAERMHAKDLDDLRSPLRYLLGRAELAKELSGLKAAPAANGRFTLTGIPKGMESRVTQLTFTVTAEGIIDGITIDETDGAVTRFTFTNQQPNPPIPPSAFHFTPPPGVEVQDAMPPI